MSKFRLVAPFVIAMLVLTACPGGDDSGDGGSPGTGGGGETEEGDGALIVTSLWGGAEEAAFQTVLASFEESSGIDVEYEPNRTDYQSVLRTRIQGGNPPDVAIIPGVGFLRQLAAEGSLIPLADLGIDVSEIEGQFAPGLLDYGKGSDGEQYAFMAKLNSKATIFYSPERFEEMGVAPAETWDDLLALTEEIKSAGSTPWALGAGDSWTLTDWFEIMYLREHGEEAYDTLFSADGDWTDPTVQATIDRMLELLTEENIDGGIDGSLSTLFVDAVAKVFGSSPSAELYFGGSFVGGIATGADVNPDLEGQEGTAIDWFEFPTIDGNGEGLVTFGGDNIAALVTTRTSWSSWSSCCRRRPQRSGRQRAPWSCRTRTCRLTRTRTRSCSATPSSSTRQRPSSSTVPTCCRVAISVRCCSRRCRVRTRLRSSRSSRRRSTPHGPTSNGTLKRKGRGLDPSPFQFLQPARKEGTP
jgi:ABC-type glycerol-3-phosphate transport system substrate-binding protein